MKIIFAFFAAQWAVAIVTVGVEALQLSHTFRASKGSILAADTFLMNTGPILATGGHSYGGRIRLWSLQQLLAPDKNASDGNYDFAAHDGSIFSLSHWADTTDSKYVVSGSFDRSAAIHRIVKSSDKNEKLDIGLETIGRLPEHTGWVRGVEAIQNGDGRIYILSIGCNLINVWTVSDADTASVARVARLDAGPSPDDPPEETFRRHDILAISVVDDMWIVAGLVDGTIRVFDVRFKVWSTRQRSSPYDATGSCTACAADDDTNDGESIVEDDTPCVSANAHDGRITAVRSISGTSDFVTVGHDARWIRWHINQDDNGSSSTSGEGISLSKVEKGCIPSPSPTLKSNGNTDGRICSCIVIPDVAGRKGEYNLFVGTTSGYLYQSCLSKRGECELLWKANGKGSKDCSVSALAWSMYEESAVIFACRSDGMVLVFR